MKVSLLYYFVIETMLDLITDHIHYLVIFMAILIIYLFVKSFTIWIIKLKAIRLLSYLMSSLFVFVFLLLMIVFLDKLDDLFIKAILQSLSFLGIVVFVFYIFSYVKNTSKKV